MAISIGDSGVDAKPVDCSGPSIITGSGLIKGTPKDDIILGSAGPDEIYGLGGDDIICGGGDDDYIDGGTGDDQIWGDDGDDEIYGGSGDDIIADHDGYNLLYGGSGRDQIRGLGELYGEAGADGLYAHPDNEDPSLLSGGTGQDFCEPSPNDDELISCEFVP
jgi:Ca2+-binding RTX toxin-like protein